MRPLLAIVLSFAAACGSSHDGGSSPTCASGTMLVDGECVAPTLTCGRGTHESSGSCVSDGNIGYLVRAPQQIVADGIRPVEIVAFGTKADGTPATDEIVFNTDRPGAGVFASPTATLDERGAITSFVPCDSNLAGCTGRVTFTVALAGAPTTPVASFTVELIAAPGIASAEHCPAGGRTLYFDGQGFVYGGKLTVTNATFNATGAAQKITFQVTPTDPVQGTKWSLEFDTTQLGLPMTPGVYEHAEPVSSVGHPGIAISGTTPYSECPQTYQGEFQVFDYSYTTSLQHATFSFRTWCPNYPEVLSGCIHYE